MCRGKNDFSSFITNLIRFNVVFLGDFYVKNSSKLSNVFHADNMSPSCQVFSSGPSPLFAHHQVFVVESSARVVKQLVNISEHQGQEALSVITKIPGARVLFFELLGDTN